MAEGESMWKLMGGLLALPVLLVQWEIRLKSTTSGYKR